MNTRSATVPVLVIAIIIQAFLLVNGQLLFGSAWSGYETVLLLYMSLDAVFLALAFTSTLPFLDIDVFNATIIFTIVFLVSAFTFSSFFRLVPITVSVNNIILDFVFQIFVVAYTEELLFRGLLLNYIGVIPQGILFGLFHLTSYYTPAGINWASIIVAMILGIAFGYIVKYFNSIKQPGIGITITWALHAAWNIAIVTTLFIL